MFSHATIHGTTVPDLHHDVARFSWQLRSSAPIRMLGRNYGMSVEGEGFAEFDQDGNIRRVIAFFELPGPASV
jgi:hypothetical protein